MSKNTLIISKETGIKMLEKLIYADPVFDQIMTNRMSELGLRKEYLEFGSQAFEKLSARQLNELINNL